MPNLTNGRGSPQNPQERLSGTHAHGQVDAPSGVDFISTPVAQTGGMLDSNGSTAWTGTEACPTLGLLRRILVVRGQRLGKNSDYSARHPELQAWAVLVTSRPADGWRHHKRGFSLVLDSDGHMWNGILPAATASAFRVRGLGRVVKYHTSAGVKRPNRSKTAKAHPGIACLHLLQNFYKTQTSSDPCHP